MYSRTYWVDHVLSATNKFTITKDTAGDDVYKVVPYGTVMQNGTYQDAAHFNNIEESLTAHETAICLLVNALIQSKAAIEQNANTADVLSKSVDKLHTVETGTVTLSNTLNFPFNNSQTTVALKTKRDTLDYIVVTDVKSFTGNVGEIIVSDVLANGFKIAFTGSASNAVINYKILGGYKR